MGRSSDLSRKTVTRCLELLPHRDVDLLGGDRTDEMEIESSDVDALADAVLVPPRQHDADARTDRKRTQKPKGRSVAQYEIREQYIDVLLERARTGLLAGMRAHDLPTSTRKREFQECGALTVIEDSEHYRRVGRNHDHLST